MCVRARVCACVPSNKVAIFSPPREKLPGARAWTARGRRAEARGPSCWERAILHAANLSRECFGHGPSVSLLWSVDTPAEPNRAFARRAEPTLSIRPSVAPR